MSQTSRSWSASGLPAYSASALVIEYHLVFGSVGKFSLRLFATFYSHKTPLRHKDLKRKHLHATSRAIKGLWLLAQLYYTRIKGELVQDTSEMNFLLLESFDRQRKKRKRKTFILNYTCNMGKFCGSC